MAISTGGIEYARVSAILDHPIDRVWAKAGEFGGLEHWADGISLCAVAGEGVGAVRTVTHHGRIVREQLDRIDVAAHEISYLILEPHAMPARNVRGTISLRPLEDGRTEFTWCSHASDFEIPHQALGQRIQQFYAASIEGLDRLLSAG
jgi:hypothetical protein